MYNNSVNSNNGIEIKYLLDDNTSSIESPLSSFNDDNFINRLIGREEQAKIQPSLRFSSGFEEEDSDSDSNGLIIEDIKIIDKSEKINSKKDNSDNTNDNNNFKKDKKKYFWKQEFLKDKICIILFFTISLVIRVASAKLLVPQIFTSYVKKDHPNYTNDEITSMASKFKSISDALPYITNFLLSPLLGVLSDRYGRKLILSIMTLTQIIDMAMVGIAFWFNMIWPFIVSHTIAGVTNGQLPIVFSYLADLTTKKERSVWFMIVGASVGISVAGGPLLEMFLIQRFGNKGAVIGNIGLLLLSYLILIPTINSLKYAEGTKRIPIINERGEIQKQKLGSINPFKSIIRLFSTSKFIGFYALLYFSFSYTSQDTINTAYYYTNIRYGWGNVQNSINTSIVGASVFIWSSLILPLLLKFMNERKIVVVCFFLSAIFHVLYAYAVNQYMWASCMALGSFSMVLLNLIQSIISKSTPSHIQGAILVGVSALSSIASAAGAYASQNIFAYFISSNRFNLYFPGMHFLINAGIIFISAFFSIYVARLPNPEEPVKDITKKLINDNSRTSIN